MSSGGTFPFSSISCARGSTLSRAKSRAVRCASSCSSESARSKPAAISVVVVVPMPVLLIGVKADVAAVGVAREEVVAVELADRAAGGLGARERGRDIVDAEPHDEAALAAHIGLGLPVVRIVHDQLRVTGSEPGRVALSIALEPSDLGVEADDLRAVRGERHYRA